MFVYELTRADDVVCNIHVNFREDYFRKFISEETGNRIAVYKSSDNSKEYFNINTEGVLTTFMTVHPEVKGYGLKARLPRVLLVGHARHGKDTVADLMQEYGYRTCASSEFAAEKFIKDWFAEHMGITYKTVEECFEDRVNHRKVWFDLITDYNTPDLTRLARELFETHDAYCGMRNKRELWACKNAGVVDHVIWVDASERLPPEDADSNTIEPWMADFVLDNNGDFLELDHNLCVLMRRIGVNRLTTIKAA